LPDALCAVSLAADLLKELVKRGSMSIFLETQLGLIKDLGPENYLIEQMGEEKD
jgi:bacterioferritin (cytochrome b1)